MKYRYHVSVAPGVEYDCVADEDVVLKRGDWVVVRCERYQDIAVVRVCFNDDLIDEDAADRIHSDAARGRQVEGRRMPAVMRPAPAEDRDRARENAERARSMHETATERIEAHGLDMKLINAHLSFDRRLAIFQFTAEGRVDFRELLRDLSRRLRTRVELRQVGVRDEAAIQGGLGSCGRPFCCVSFLKRFSSINVKMAKKQGLSLNPANISGACGRLKCCLQYDAHLYRGGSLREDVALCSSTDCDVGEVSAARDSGGSEVDGGNGGGQERGSEGDAGSAGGSGSDDESGRSRRSGRGRGQRRLQTSDSRSRQSGN